MKIFSSLIRYHYSLYVKTNKFIMPALLWVIFLNFSYSQQNRLEFVSSTLLSISFLFFIILWVAISYMESVDSVSEQILLLKIEKRNTYYLSKNVFVFFLGAALSLIGVLFPILLNALSGFTLFARPLTLWDVLCTFILHIIIAILGASLGIVFQPRCMKNRKEALMFVTLIAIISMTKAGIIDTFSHAKYITWVFPPLSDIILYFGKNVYFSAATMGKAVLYCCVYSAILLFISNHLLKRKLF